MDNAKIAPTVTSGHAMSGSFVESFDASRLTLLQQAAKYYASQGWTPIPLHHVTAGRCSCPKGQACRSAGKHPVDTAWQESGLHLDRWDRAPWNVGIKTGNGLVIIDFDGEEGEATLSGWKAAHPAEDFETRTITTGSGGTHLYYRDPGVAIRNSVRKIAPGVDVRGEGGQVVAPPSVSLKGAYRRNGNHPVRAIPDWLLGILMDTTPKNSPQAYQQLCQPAAPRADSGDRFSKWVTAAVNGVIDELRAAQALPEGVTDSRGRGWDKITADAAHRLASIALSPWNGYTLSEAMADHATHAPTGKGWSATDVAAKWRRESNRAQPLPEPPQASHAPQRAQQAPTPPPAEPEPTQEHLELPPPSDPVLVAREILDRTQIEGFDQVARWRNTWYQWDGTHWESRSEEEHRNWLIGHTEDAMYWGTDRNGDPELKRWAPTVTKIKDLAEMMKARTASNAAPREWRGEQPHGEGAYVNLANGVLHVPTRQLTPHTPAWWCTIPPAGASWDPNAPVPTRWIAFIDEAFGGDQDKVRLLKQWMGYVLSGRTDLHKAMYLHGPRRSGKSTILRVIERLLGEAQGAVSSEAFSSEFGLSGVIDKALITVADARWSNTGGGATTAERILSITGEDAVSVNRKNREYWSGRLPARLMFVGNHLPNWNDSSGALPGRFLLLSTDKTAPVLDPHLTDTLSREASGILNWALDGLDDLTASGAFHEGGAVGEASRDLAEDADPIGQFLACTVAREEGATADSQHLYALYQDWCRDNGLHPQNSTWFGRALPVGVTRKQVRRQGGRRGYVYTGIKILPTL